MIPQRATEDKPVLKEGPVTPERFRSAASAIRRALEGSNCLEDLDAAFVQVSALSSRGPSDATDTSADMMAARADYHAALRNWNEHLPALREWLITEKKRIESGLAQGTGVRAWLRAHGQTR